MNLVFKSRKQLPLPEIRPALRYIFFFFTKKKDAAAIGAIMKVLHTPKYLIFLYLPCLSKSLNFAQT